MSPACTVRTTSRSPRVASTSVSWIGRRDTGRAPALSWIASVRASSKSRPVMTESPPAITSCTIGALMSSSSRKMPSGKPFTRVVICSNSWLPSPVNSMATCTGGPITSALGLRYLPVSALSSSWINPVAGSQRTSPDSPSPPKHCAVR